MQEIELNKCRFLLPNDSSLLSEGNDKNNIKKYFDINFWRVSKQIVGQSTGRNITWFLKPNFTNKTWVLRHYYRGGLIAKLICDSYLYLGVKSTRIYKEMALLEKMIELQLPVPKPIAGKIHRKGMYYSADLLMEKLDAQDLVALLTKSELTETAWHLIGKTISDFHHQGIYHSDLNAHNIMIGDDNKIWLIDFDRCEQRKISDSWQQENLDRLKRSFEKESIINSRFYFNDKVWDILLQGYKN